MSNYTKPELRRKIFRKVLNTDVQGTKAGQWSARKALLVALIYKKYGGGYKSEPNKKQKDLIKWTEQNWRTKSGKPSHKTGERYLPEKAIKSLSDKDYAKTSRKKREDTKKGIQFSRQPKEIAKKVKKFRT